MLLHAPPVLVTLILLYATHLSPALRAQDPSALVDGETARAADAYLERLEALGFSGAALIVEDGLTVLRKGYGLADRETGVPITAASVFSLGSITKQFTAAAILALEAQNRLSFDDPIGKYFSDVPPGKQPITLHHLLTHSSGFESDFAATDFDRAASATPTSGGRSTPSSGSRRARATSTRTPATACSPRSSRS